MSSLKDGDTLGFNILEGYGDQSLIEFKAKVDITGF